MRLAGELYDDLQALGAPKPETRKHMRITDLDPADPTILIFPCRGADPLWRFKRSHLAALEERFAAINALSSVHHCHSWLSADPTRLRTADRMETFLASWVERDFKSSMDDDERDAG